MKELDSVIRDTLRDLADETRSAQLAAPALRRARGIRVRRAVLTAAGAVVAVAAIATPYLILDGRGAGGSDADIAAPLVTQPGAEGSGTPQDNQPEAGPPAAQTVPLLAKGPITLPGGYIVGSGTGVKGTWIWDRVKGGYRNVPYDFARPAPVGNLVVVQTGTRSQAKLGVLDLATDKVRWIPTGWPTLGTPQWSADGKRLVYELEGKTLDVYIADATTGSTRKLFIHDCESECGVWWLPGDAEVAVGSGEKGNRVYSATTGQKVLDLPFGVMSRDAWSPDRSRAVARVVIGGNLRVGLVDTTTGTLVNELNSLNIDPRVVYWTSDNQILAITQEGITTFTPGGERLSTYPFPREFVPNELPNFSLIKI